MKLPLMAAVAALAFWGCSSNSANTRADEGAIGGSGSETTAPDSVDTASDDGWDDRSPGEAGNVSNNERRDRRDAPTVYDDEATGGGGPGLGAGSSVTNSEGERYDVQHAPLMGGQQSDAAKKSGVGGSGNTQGVTEEGASEVEELGPNDVQTQEVELDEVEVD